jgi:hypothetical protein
VTQTLEGLQRLLRNELPPEPELLRRGDAWADTLLDALGTMPSGEAAAWQGLLSHCATATPARPSSKWLARAKQAMSGLDPAPVLISCLDRIGEPGSRKVQSATGQPHEPDRTLLDDGQTDLLRGLVWCAGLVDDPAAVPALAAAVGRAADACFRKVQNHGPRNAKVGNACVDTLSRLGAPAAVAQLSRLRSRVQHPSARKQIEAALGRAAGRLGLAKAELEEMMVPGQGLTEAEIRKLLPGQRDRLERLYLFPRDWDVPIWRERYLEHPLVGILARRLIWKFGDRPGFWREGRIVDAEGQPLEDLEGARVSLWHPLDAPADEVLAWRRCLEAWEVVQPFKQAHREIYLLTDAERQTATYSNRFAAHLLKQHQLAALCRQRGWTCALQGRFDFHDNPVLKLPEHGLQVEFWVDPAAEEEISAAGIFVYVSTDQVRFCEIGGLPRPLEEIPPLLFSELMRDVDLFVSVASIGNDPSWGQDRQDADAWRRSSFGELGESARTRRELLGRLVPRLKIADRCTLTERFLVVRGDLRTYKIHLGSSNILMAPNDQYLCIVQGRTDRDSQPVLPFEGDGTLALILSKAFLLADDTKITDPQIRSQIGR